MDPKGQLLRVETVDTPLGPLWIGATERGVRVVTVPGGTRDECVALLTRGLTASRLAEGGALAEELAAEITAYFAGALRAFSVPLDLVGTPFQRRVWQAVAAVPYGTTSTYRQVAEGIGAPNAYRAVGAANGANPAAIVIPCHRLIGSDGSLTGYGGGLAAKRALLDLERRVCDGDNDISH